MLSLYFNVKDPVIGTIGDGAIGDGVADDRAAIQRAYDACAAIGGGTIFFPRGTYLCGESDANQYSFLIDNTDNVRWLGCGWGGSVLKQSGSAASGAFDLFRISGGSEATEFEGLTFDQSGLTSPGTDQCNLINVLEAHIVKIIDCRFTGGVTNAGAYVRIGGVAGDLCDIVYITDCDMRDAGGPAIQIDGEVDAVFILDNTLVQTGSELDVVYINDTASAPISNVKVLNNKVTSAAGYAVRASSADVLDRVMISENVLLGFVGLDGLTKSQFQNNQVYATAAGLAVPVLSIANCTHVQAQKNILSRGAGCDDGLVCKVDTSTRIQVQSNQWIQEVPESGILHCVDTTILQLSHNYVRMADAGASTTVAYLIEAATVPIDNIQIIGDNIKADTGTWLYAVHFKSNTETIGAIQVVPGIFEDCATGVYLDENGGGAGRFSQPNYIMIAGGVIDASTAAYGISTTGVFIRIGANASTFGAQMIAGNGSPNTVVTARVGSTYLRLDGDLDGGATTTLYVKESRTTSSGWIGK